MYPTVRPKFKNQNMKTFMVVRSGNTVRLNINFEVNFVCAFRLRPFPHILQLFFWGNSTILKLSCYWTVKTMHTCATWKYYSYSLIYLHHRNNLWNTVREKNIYCMCMYAMCERENNMSTSLCVSGVRWTQWYTSHHLPTSLNQINAIKCDNNAIKALCNQENCKITLQMQPADL